MSELTPEDDEETVNLASTAMIFSSCALLFGLERKGVTLCGFKATWIDYLGVVRLSALNRTTVCPFRWS